MQKNKSIFLVGGFIVLGLFLVFLIINRDRKEVQEVNSTQSPQMTETLQKNKSTFFIVTDSFEEMADNLYQVRINDVSQRIQLTDYIPSSPDAFKPSLDNIQAIDENYLGYNRCDVEAENFNCGIFRLDLSTKNTENVAIADQGDLIDSLAFFDKNTFVYSVLYGDQDKGRIFLVKDGKKTILKEVNFVSLFGLNPGEAIEGFIDNLFFSPDGTKILAYIGPGPAGGNGDTFIFDVYGKEIKRLPEAEKAQWDNNNTFIFSLADGLYIFDVITGDKKRLLEGFVREPKILGESQKIVYWIDEGKGETWLYDMKTEQNEKIVENASHPLWISPKEIMFSYNDDSVYSDKSRSEGFTQSIMVYNISSKEKYEAFDMSDVDGEFEFLSPLKNIGSHSFYHYFMNEYF
jgi:hypothetical protein